MFQVEARKFWVSWNQKKTTRKPQLEVATTTTLARYFRLDVIYLQRAIQVWFAATVGHLSSRWALGFLLWPWTLVFELDLDSVKWNQHTTYLYQSSFSSKVIVRTHTHIRTIAQPGPLSWSVTKSRQMNDPRRCTLCTQTDRQTDRRTVRHKDGVTSCCMVVLL